MSALPAPPPEPSRITDMSGLAPAFNTTLGHLVSAMQSLGYEPIPFETLRTSERQQWLYGFGRTWDDPGDPRGEVTQDAGPYSSWHFFGLAVDFVPKPGSNATGFYESLGRTAKAFRLTPGQLWQHLDPPHVQWFIPGMFVSPSAHALELFQRGGRSAVWRALSAE